jgi:DNA/RNA-binding domain of Phe-tRNA-synthetase-like protein
MRKFVQIDENLVKLGLKFRYVIGKNVSVEKNNILDSLKQTVVENILHNLNNEKITNDHILVEYQKLHELTAGEKGKEYVASLEWLLKFILDKHKFIHINNIVDCYNVISVQTHIAIGSHDLSKVEGKLKMAHLNGDERFIPLGLSFATKVPKGGYAFSDDNDVLCLFESRQAEKTKITLQTTSFITYLQGNAETSDEYLNQATLSLLNSYKEHCKGVFILDTDYKQMMMDPVSGG